MMGKQFTDTKRLVGLVAVLALFCGLSFAKSAKVADHDHRAHDVCHLEPVDAHTHCDDVVQDCGDANHEPCEDSHEEGCPDTPHHHHSGAGCCQAVSVHAARMAPMMRLRAPVAGRASVEWKNQRCDLDAVRELVLPPII